MTTTRAPRTQTQAASRTARDRARSKAERPTPWTFTVDEWERLIAAGVFRDGERVELIEGEIIAMPPMYSPHAACILWLAEFFIRRLPPDLQARVQLPLRLSSRSEPQPDIAIVRRRADNYRSGHPTGDGTPLIVEVSDSTLSYDRRVKAPLYARARVPDFWIVDLRHRVVEVHQHPTDGQYLNTANVRAGDTLITPFLPDVVLAIDEMLPSS